VLIPHEPVGLQHWGVAAGCLLAVPEVALFHAEHRREHRGIDPQLPLEGGLKILLGVAILVVYGQQRAVLPRRPDMALVGLLVPPCRQVDEEDVLPHAGLPLPRVPGLQQQDEVRGCPKVQRYRVGLLALLQGNFAKHPEICCMPLQRHQVPPRGGTIDG
jgi:hypothetical protein